MLHCAYSVFFLNTLYMVTRSQLFYVGLLRNEGNARHIPRYMYCISLILSLLSASIVLMFLSFFMANYMYSCERNIDIEKYSNQREDVYVCVYSLRQINNELIFKSSV